jgi:hypothetical protein
MPRRLGGDTLEDPQLGETPEEAETRAQDEAAAVAGMQGLLQAPTQGVKQAGDDLSTVKLYVVSKGKGGATIGRYVPRARALL